ncbi:MAG: hypothetical protein J2P21_02980 [Chloracidobacterium sp.]|nr:hypothetical protein [Chloracidobacterium sp.]
MFMHYGPIAALSVGLCVASLSVFSQRKGALLSWRRLLRLRLPVYGHRNWIVIADSAYPAQSRAGIETIVTDGDQLVVVREVLSQLSKYQHVRPTVYLDAELSYVAENYAPGIGAYRDWLKKLLGELDVHSAPHEQIIDKLDEAGEKFNVLILKTNLTLPYTSVFLKLDCGYWSSEAEQRLRETMKSIN